ncbi:TetR/AcrR family transcriptional regulator [Microlunatus spumicola]|uniref:TetR/AcrR family transcriptional regulator n=1 Tax=Microlunatus spumicola TaxID=81499 RepID=A0ABP6XHZ2_9ACTN
MSRTPPEAPSSTASDRRDAVLESALLTFARFGYRKTSMDEVAREARISRPGLYFHFPTKDALFRAAVTRALEHDLAEIETVLGATRRPLRERLVEAFDVWAGRYVGPGARDVTAVIDANPDLLGPVVETAPRRFAELVTQALAVERPQDAVPLARTLVSTSIGLKHQVEARADHRRAMATAVDLLLR